jgi:hypothetical protein
MVSLELILAAFEFLLQVAGLQNTLLGSVHR